MPENTKVPVIFRAIWNFMCELFSKIKNLISF